MSDKESLKIQYKLVALLLKHKDIVERYKESNLNAEYFDETLKEILYAIESAYEDDVLLTRGAFQDFVRRLGKSNAEVAAFEVLFNKINLSDTNKNNYPLYAGQITDEYLVSQASNIFRDFAQDQKDKGISAAISTLSEKIINLQDFSVADDQILYEDVTNLADEYYDYFIDVREGKIVEEFTSSGYEEIDKTTQTGLNPGGLTLFCADVGSFKSTMMLNVAMNVWLKEEKNVLFIPLEMPHRQIQNKMISRHTGIPFEYVNSPKSLSEDQMKMIENTVKKDWPERKGKFYIFDSMSKRMTVAALKREIKRHIEIFKPSLVVVDYIANLEADQSRHGRNDLEIGDMLKNLRHMGREKVLHEKGFHVISGAQLGREALKRVRRGSDAVSFNSEDIRGSHEYSADADNMFVLYKDPQQPNERLLLYPVKCRYGSTTLPDGQNKAVLEVRPNIGYIRSSQDFYNGNSASDVLTKSDEMDLDAELDFLDDMEENTDSSVSNFPELDQLDEGLEEDFEDIFLT